MARLPPSRHPLHCGLRIPDLRARDDSPLNGSCHQGVPAICRTRRLPAQRIRRCGLNATFRTRLQQCDGDWSPLSPRCYRVAHAARLGTDTEICDTVRLVGCGVRPAGEGNPCTDDDRLHPDHRPNVVKCLWLTLYERVEALLRRLEGWPPLAAHCTLSP